MSETIIPTVAMRRGELVEFHGVPEQLPDVLANFVWPKDYAKRLDAAGKVAAALYQAHADWVEAHEEFESVAPAQDQKALEDAIRAAKPDPGTPATEKADRAEHVAWTRLQLALEDARATTQRQVVTDYLREQARHLAEHELTREQAFAEATSKAAAIMAEASSGSNKPGGASTAMKQYVANRWTDQDDHDTLLIPKDTDTEMHKRAIAERNAEILARWQREANGEPEPAYDFTTAKASELGTAAEYGSTKAEAELARRRKASVDA